MSLERFLLTLLARPVSDDDPDEEQIADLLADPLLWADEAALTARLRRELDAIEQPSSPLLARIAQALDRHVGHETRIAMWRDLSAQYPTLPAVALFELRAWLAAADQGIEDIGSGDGESSFSIRERYSELLEDFADDPAVVADLRAMGRLIARLEKAGILPRVMVRRGAWRTDEPDE